MIDAIYRQTNRTNLIKSLGGGIVVLTAHTLMQRVNDAVYDFQQEANFLYLTGIEEPDWWLILDGARNKSWLVSPEIDDVHRIFEGGMTSAKAVELSGVTHVITRDEAEALLRELAAHHSLVYAIGDDPYASHYNFFQNPAQKDMWRRLSRTFGEVRDCRKSLVGLRAIKQDWEIDAMKRAIRLTNDAFRTVRQKLPELRYEHEIEAEFDYAFRRAGRATHAYDPIIAAGLNACTLHYTKNTARLKKTDLILLDVGARVDGYAADITRTYNLRPTKRQQQVHDAVVDASRRIIALLGPDRLVVDYFAQVDEIMKDALESLGLLDDRTDQEAYRNFFPHSVSHGLGIDVHDSLGGPRYFQPGMVLTVEPGIYIPEESIGVRIEDDILITANGYLNLSADLSTDI